VILGVAHLREHGQVERRVDELDARPDSATPPPGTLVYAVRTDANVDVLAEPGSQVGLSCRRYPAADGYEGAPTLEQLRAVLTGA